MRRQVSIVHVDDVLTAYEYPKTTLSKRLLKRSAGATVRLHPVMRLDEHRAGVVEPGKVFGKQIFFEPLDIDLDDKQRGVRYRRNDVINRQDRHGSGF